MIKETNAYEVSTYDYYADAGSLAIGTDGLTVLFPNRAGDGDFKVYVSNVTYYMPVNEKEWDFITSFTAEDDCKIYRSDCSTDVVAGIVPAGRYGVYAHESGDMWLELWPE